LEKPIILPLNILLLLYRNGGFMTKNNICEHLKISESKLNSVMEVLSERKYVKVQGDKVYLTPIGRLVIEELSDLLAFSR